MIEESAIVVKIENHQVWIEGESISVCGGCQQKASCTTNALGSVLKKKSVLVDTDIQLKTGDQVMVAIDENLLLRASLLLYLVPLIALFIGAGLADGLVAETTQYADIWIASSAIASFLVSLWIINKAQCLLIMSYTRPVVVRKIQFNELGEMV